VPSQSISIGPALAKLELRRSVTKRRFVTNWQTPARVG